MKNHLDTLAVDKDRICLALDTDEPGGDSLKNRIENVLTYDDIKTDLRNFYLDGSDPGQGANK